MNKITISTEVIVYTYEELPPRYKELIDAAKAQTANAYAPYSQFKVGAAALLSNNEIICGSNQENAAYPSGTCAERTTLFYANARYPQSSVCALAVAAYQSGDFLEEPISPCGACRQVILESEERFGSPIDILLYGKRNIYLFKGARALLPFCFVGETMGYTIQTEKNTAYGKNTV